jgi:hypothetical protein
MPGPRHAATALLLALPLSLAPVTAAFAAPPDRYSFEVDDTGLSRTSEECGFDIMLPVEGTIRVLDFLDQDGNQTRTLVTYPGMTYTFSNAETGESVTSRSPDPEHLTWDADGGGTLRVTGLVLHWLVPGDGVVGQAGAFTVSWDGEGNETETEPVGLHEDYHAALCEILAP